MAYFVDYRVLSLADLVINEVVVHLFLLNFLPAG